MTLHEIGKIFGLTRMRICQIEKRALQKIKQALGSYLASSS
jgi:DNA-directed RNA polymerase sigma subunit (sigma70/sigma32)